MADLVYIAANRQAQLGKLYSLYALIQCKVILSVHDCLIQPMSGQNWTMAG